MNDGSQITPATIRGEIKALFGIRWDTALEWTVICWLSAWIMTSTPAYPGAFGDIRIHGPVSWIADGLRGMEVDAPSWIDGISAWLRDPSRAWVEPALLVISAVLVTAAVRNYQLSGLRAVGLLALAGAIEISRSYSSAGWVFLLALAPALAAIVTGVVSGLMPRDYEEPRTEFYYPRIIVATFLTQVVLLLLAPLFAPLLLLAMLVIGYKSTLPYRPALELAYETRRRLESSTASISELDALTASSVLVSAALAGNNSRDAEQIAAGFHLTLKERRQGEELRRREERQLGRI